MEFASDNQTLIIETREMMRRQLDHLVALVDDLLEVSRISQGKLKLRHQVVSIMDAVHSAIETCRPLIEESNHHLKLALPSEAIYVEGDPHRLTQMLANLLNNAVKYTPRGGQISIGAWQDGNDAVIAVRIRGSALRRSSSHTYSIYLHRSKKNSSNYAGLGIGLSLVKSLVEMHGGTILAESEGMGCGSTFTIRLPTTQCEVSTGQGQTVDFTPGPHIRRRVLVVDDNLSAVKLLSMLVQMLGHEVTTASNGQEAIERGREFVPDIIFMDIGMPVMDGYQAARTIRSEAWGKEAELIALTGWGQDDDKQKTRDAGFDQHLVKPVEAEVIRHLLADLPATKSKKRSDA